MTILGTRPEIIRLAAIIKKLDKFCNHILVHTGQNYDYELNNVFFEDLELREPDIQLQVKSDTLHGQIANMFLSNLFLTDLKTKFALIWIILASFVSCLLFFFIRRIEFVVLTNVIIGIIYLIGIIILFDKGAVVNMIHVTLSWGLTTLSLGLYKSLIGEKERKIIKATFSKYVSPHVLEELLTSPEKVVLGGEEKEITVLFSDIRGFTSISERPRPQN